MIRIDLQPCKVKPSSHDRWALTGVPHGNLSLAHTEVITVASYPRLLSSLTCARSLTGCFQHAHSSLPSKGGNPSSKDYSASNSMMLQATLVYRVPYTRHVTSTIQKLIKGMPRTGLNQHRRGYATKEAGSAVHFPVLGPIGLARSQILIPYFIIIITFQ